MCVCVVCVCVCVCVCVVVVCVCVLVCVCVCARAEKCPVCTASILMCKEITSRHIFKTDVRVNAQYAHRSDV